MRTLLSALATTLMVVLTGILLIARSRLRRYEDVLS